MSFPLPPDYAERVYAGVLGKLIGVYLGRPFEQWSHEKIVARFGEIRRYVHEALGVPLIVSDDDITGTFTFLRALADHPGAGADLSSRQIGQSWLNYIAEGKHILWWGGMGMSTEHTAFLRLQAGVEAPESGSIARNGRAVAEEIGAQIFVDGWALVSPNQPEQAVRLARAAGSVSHDGEAVHAAAMLAAMEALAFSESDISTLIERGLAFIPADSGIAQITADLRRWHAQEPDWKVSLRRLRDAYGYERHGTNCPAQPNFGIILLALLYGSGDFSESLMIVNTAGYDTDCNSGNVGCLLGIRGGLAAIGSSDYDWRGPINDQMYQPAADGHRGVTDAATVATEIANLGRTLSGQGAIHPKGGARYHFDLPGATHGFTPTPESMAGAPEAAVGAGLARSNERALVLAAPGGDTSVGAEVATFLPPEALTMKGYAVAATPSLYPGQEVVAAVANDNDGGEGSARLFVRSYQPTPGLRTWAGPWQTVRAGEAAELRWTVPPTDGWPVATVGVEWCAERNGDILSSLALRSLTWTGQPELTFAPPAAEGDIEPWTRSFVHDLDLFTPRWLAPFNLAKNRGVGLVHTGGRDWRDYEVSADIKPVIGDDWGLVGRVQGLTRYYGLIATREGGGKLRLVRAFHGETVLAETALDWPLNQTRRLSLSLLGNRLTGRVDGRTVLEAEDADSLLDGGSAGWRVTAGRLECGPLEVRRMPA